jgi:hypothetical protein
MTSTLISARLSSFVRIANYLQRGRPDVGVKPIADAERFNVRAAWMRRLKDGNKPRTGLVDEKSHAQDQAAGEANLRSRAAADANTAQRLSEVRLGESDMICSFVMLARPVAVQPGQCLLRPSTRINIELTILAEKLEDLMAILESARFSGGFHQATSPGH